MNLIYSQIKDLYNHFDKRQHSYDDFEVLAKRENVKIRLVEYPEHIKGYYCIRKNKKYTEKFIVINKNLSSFEKLYVAFHEWAHSRLHVPFNAREYFYCSLHEKTHEKQEKEADTIALIMLIPRWLLFQLQDTPFDELHPYTQEILIKRQKLYEDQGV